MARQTRTCTQRKIIQRVTGLKGKGLYDIIDFGFLVVRPQKKIVCLPLALVRQTLFPMTYLKVR